MWRTKSSYTSEGWYRSIAAGNPPPPLLRFSFSRRGDGSLWRGIVRGCVSFLLGSRAGLGRRRFLGSVGERSCRFAWDLGASRRVALVQNWVLGRWWVFVRSALGWLPLADRAVASPPVSVSVCAGRCGDGRGCLGQRPSKMGARDRRFHAIFASDWWEGAGSGVKRRSRARTRANGMVCGCSWTLDCWLGLDRFFKLLRHY